MVGFERPDGRMVVVVTNRHTVIPRIIIVMIVIIFYIIRIINVIVTNHLPQDQRVEVRLTEGGRSSEKFEVGPQSVHSLLW